MKSTLRLLLCLLTGLALAENITWTGAAGDNYWTNPDNWDLQTRRFEATDAAVARHLQETIRRDLPVRLSAFLRETVAAKVVESYDKLDKMPPPPGAAG